MVQSRSGSRLAPKTLQHLGIAGDLVGQKFERHEAAQFGVFCLVNDAHSTDAQLFEDAVASDGLAHHRGKILRWRNWQVNESRGVGRASKGSLLKNPDYTHNPVPPQGPTAPIHYNRRVRRPTTFERIAAYFVKKRIYRQTARNFLLTPVILSVAKLHAVKCRGVEGPL